MNGDSSDLLNSIFLGEVASVQNYGAFISIPGSKNQGLVHKSQVSKGVVDDATEVLQKGERVWCKVIKILEDGKIALSMKVVDQGSGRDLDPNGVQFHQDEQRRKSMPAGGGRRAITLEAVLKTTCTKCGVNGHLSKDCFQSPTGKVYELIPEDEPTVPTVDDMPPDKEKLKKAPKRKKEKKHKKEKKKKRKKERHATSSESEDDSDSSGRRDRKKHKKRDRSRSRSPKKRKK
ncbi:zinc finger CCHC domain-containing protein 17-like [Macrosteles quadrilineatus]|uniref:zinc finger CCHC domain-containing protein 17-like n=1 Tax=Macrosteles quadrilineatus TaxID=74068 RepID=UPI0023E2A758|nr:zinc finger CCHC domain-containing protein 17-like [Macrosteles quadrilineatus]